MSIKSISTRDVAKITSGQVIIDLVSVVKELVENAIDAGSDKIEITFNNYGTVSVEVADNGHGIEAEDFASLALKHHTSKLTSFEDLLLVNTLGFRGEAMSSLCSVATVKISTCTSSSFPRATELHFDSLGQLTSQKTVVSGKKGTIVTVSDLFLGMPVRQKNFIKNSKREYSKALTLLMAYLLTYTSIRFTVFNVSGSTGKKTMAMGTQGGKMSTMDVLVSVFGSNGGYGLVPIDFKSSNIDARFKLNMHSVPMNLSVRLSGYISDASFGLGRGTGDRQFLTVNKRPVIHKRIAKVINDVYKTFNTTQFPVFVLDLEVDTAFVDVNVTPDKRMVLMQSEEVVLEVLREKMFEFFENKNNLVPKGVLGAVNMGSQAVRKEKFEGLVRRLENSDKTDIEENEMGSEDEKQKERESTSLILDAVQDDLPENEDDRGRYGNDQDSPSVLDDLETSEVAPDGPPIRKDYLQNLEHKDYEEVVDNFVEPSAETTTEESFPSHEIGHNSQDVSSKPNSLSSRRDAHVEQVKTMMVDRRAHNNDSGEKEGDMNADNQPSASSHMEACGKKQVVGDDCLSESPATNMEIRPGAGLVRNRSIPESDRTWGHTIAAQGESEQSDNNDVDQFEDLQETAIHELFVDGSDQEGAHDGQLGAISRGYSEASTHTRLRLRRHGAPLVVHDVDASPSNNGEPAGPNFEGRSDRLPGQLYRQQYRLGFKIPLVIDTWQVKSDAHAKEDLKNSGGVHASIHDLTQALEIKKSDFQQMQVVGQFNLGFIVVVHLGKLFIVDQHALDEIYNYEKLMRTLVLRAQPLVVARTLELSAVDEMVMLEHLVQLRKNGFIVEEDPDAPPGHRAKLVAVPVLKNVAFDDSDLHELVHKLNQVGTSASQSPSHRLRLTVRCTKVDGMIALRACRLSIMVGQPLGKNSMVEVVKHLATLDRPWNCPHGRPTMRHLVDLEGHAFGEDYEV